VHRSLGYGFFEKVHENALVIVLEKTGFQVKQQTPITITFDNKVVGGYIADILLDNKIALELKAVIELSSIHEVKLVNFLKASCLCVGLLINCGPSSRSYARSSELNKEK
jgi:GxxExxY protein